MISWSTFSTPTRIELPSAPAAAWWLRARRSSPAPRPSAGSGWAAGAADAAETAGDYLARDFRFSDGSVLPEVRLHYTTLGRLRRDAAGHATNAVLLLHGTTGSGAQFLTKS
ncbi:hypothetical protein PPH41_30615, partial [Burkholderia gladioli]|nr:hypothetical protein [Burkholderia gladioli]